MAKMRLANLKSVDVNASGTVMLPTAPDNTLVRRGACSLSLDHASFAERDFAASLCGLYEGYLG